MMQEEIIAHLVSGPTGLHVSFDDLSIYRLEDGRYAVNWTENPKRTSSRHRDDWEEIFSCPLQAAKLFERKRNEYELGFEHEVPEDQKMDFLKEQCRRQFRLPIGPEL